MLTKEEIKKWMKENKKDRFWLAVLCNTGKRAVDKWFEKKNKLPPKAILILQEHMKESRKDAFEEKEGYAYLEVKCPTHSMPYLKAAARKHNQTITERLDHLIQEEIKEYAKEVNGEEKSASGESPQE